MITEFPIPTPGSEPYFIAAGPDGNVWFAELNGGKIARVTPSGVITEFLILTPLSFPGTIASVADGNLWFGEIQNGQIGRITTEGVGLVAPAGFLPGWDTRTCDTCSAGSRQTR